MFNALYQLLTRKLNSDGIYTALFYSALAGAVGLTLILPWVIGREPISLRDGILFVLLGVLAGLGHWLIIRAYQNAPAASLTPYTYVQMIWGTGFGYFVFDQFPDLWSVVGMTIIVASGFLLAFQERRTARVSVQIPWASHAVWKTNDLCKHVECPGNAPKPLKLKKVRDPQILTGGEP